MQRNVFSIVALLVALCVSLSRAQITAGAARIDATLPLGTPLAGYNHGPRRVPFWPLFQFGEYTSWMMPSVGVIEPIYARALVINDNQNTSVCFVSVDGIGADKTMRDLAYDIAVGMGFTLPKDNFVMSASHTHSGPGAIAPDFLWSIAPATDIMVPKLQRMFAESMAMAMVKAEQDQEAAHFGIGSSFLTGVTQNRRAGKPPLASDTIDPHLGVIRVDDYYGNPIATLWNYAVHGTCYGSDNMNFSSEYNGVASNIIESQIGGVALYVNADAGDIDPLSGMCDEAPMFKGSGIIADAVVATRDNLTTTTALKLSVYSQDIDIGPTQLNMTFDRFADCDSGGILDICSICAAIDCDLNAHIPTSWLTQVPTFTAIRFDADLETTPAVFVTLPGEPLVELGWWVRNDTLDLGFETTLLAGYSQAHCGYFATPDQYDFGGYESQLSFFGRETAEIIRTQVYKVASTVAYYDKYTYSDEE